MNDSIGNFEAGARASLRLETQVKLSRPETANRAEKFRPRLTRAEKRRRRIRNQYNREYMRRWRATPGKKIRKKRRHRRVKPRSAQGRFRSKAKSPAENCGNILWGICRRLQATCVVTRFQITEETESGYRAVRVPYCGTC